MHQRRQQRERGVRRHAGRTASSDTAPPHVGSPAADLVLPVAHRTYFQARRTQRGAAQPGGRPSVTYSISSTDDTVAIIFDPI